MCFYIHSLRKVGELANRGKDMRMVLIVERSEWMVDRGKEIVF